MGTRTEATRVESDLVRNAHARPTFADCAGRHVEKSRAKRRIDVINWHVALLQSHIGHSEPQQVHDQTLEPFIKARRAAGTSPTTINRSLEAVRTILNRAAHFYRDRDGRPYFDGMPPLATMLANNPRLPHQITWAEQYAFFRRLPAHLAVGVSAEDREVLLGHANHSRAGHTASADVGSLLEQANLVLNRSGTQALLRITEGSASKRRPLTAFQGRKKGDLALRAKPIIRKAPHGTGGQVVPRRSHRRWKDLVFKAKSLNCGAPGRI